jgi:hypothetical protein
MKDGWINLTASGGEAPYIFKWSNEVVGLNWTGFRQV